MVAAAGRLRGAGQLLQPLLQGSQRCQLTPRCPVGCRLTEQAWQRPVQQAQPVASQHLAWEAPLLLVLLALLVLLLALLVLCPCSTRCRAPLL